MTYGSFLELEEATLEMRTIRYVTDMSKYFTQTRPSRLLTSCIIMYVKAKGGMANENVQGSMRKEGKGWKFIYSGGQPGQEDISVKLNGKFYAIEIKIGRDVQSITQKRYQAKLERAGFEYFIIRNFDEFLEIIWVYLHNNKVVDL